jgi:hypothetical protein
MPFNSIHYVELKDAANALLRDARGRGNEVIFGTIARVWYGELNETGLKPRCDLTAFGRYLGLDDKAINRLRNASRDHATVSRRVIVGGRCHSGGLSARNDWVLEDGSKVRR